MSLRDWCNKWKDVFNFLNLIVILITGGVVTYIVSCNQNKNATTIADSQDRNRAAIEKESRRISALQIFSDRLTGDRVTREMTLDVIDNLTDKELVNKLREISNKITLERLRDSIWNESSSVRENAIIEYAKLYKFKKYQSEILDALMPRNFHLPYWNPTISIAKFFYYLQVFSNSLWYGTKKDLMQFATIEESPWYHKKKNPAGWENNLPKFLDICKKNFRLDTTLNYKGKGLINLNWNNYENERWNK